MSEDTKKVRIDKVRDLEKMGINPYPYKFESKNTIRAIREKFELDTKDLPVSTKGIIKRISNTDDGIMIRLEDEEKQIVCYISNEHKSEFSTNKVGDEILVKGFLKRINDSLSIIYSPDANPSMMTTIREITNAFDLDPKYEKVSIAGRLITIRDQGKAVFGHIRDIQGRIQVYFKKDILGDEKFNLFKDFVDVGDILGVEGRLFRTKTGELTVEVEKFEILSKCLNEMPEKWHGLRDPEVRYRHRYLDLIANTEVGEIFMKRSKIISKIRDFFNSRGFYEVETPILHQIASGASAKPFTTYHNALDENLYLRIAPELFLKKLIVGGFDRVYEIGKNFRNEGIDVQHNPEFTMMEFYVAYWDYFDLMKFTEELLSFIAYEVNGSYKVKYGENDIDFTPPYRRVKYFEFLKEATGKDKEFFLNEASVRSLARELGIHEEKLSHPKVIDKVFEHFSGDRFIQPTFVIDFPKILSPLAKTHRDDPDLVERFELFVGGFEIANAYTELNDPIDQRNRFEEQLKRREQGDEEALMVDEDFITALEYGLPPTAGEGIGIDRLVMLLTNSHSIREVILFPTLRQK
ncbi:MAG: lysine--tRNA ligase [Spirochaetia bacterium]|nr:lysine--tRNA ligase [Spirochaetota bacterium]MDW8112254.1 lysine--tRNA ligase [Spirochaetia bacterium]